MYSHERSLVTRLEGKPFAFVGVNSDADLQDSRHVAVTQQLPWRSWWDGSTTGPIAQRWQVHNWPSFFVLDGRGVIRYRLDNVADLERAVDTLLREREKEGKT